MAPIELVMLLVAIAAIALAVLASLRVLGAREPPGRTAAQLLFVWLVPILGPLVTMQIHRREPERRGLAETDDPGEVPGKIDQRSATFRPHRREQSEVDGETSSHVDSPGPE